jgi:hypothetical protein
MLRFNGELETQKECGIMRSLTSLMITLGLTGAAVMLPAVAAAQQDEDQAGVQEAIRYEKAKQAAADRQERIEAAKEKGMNAADRAEEPRSKPAPTVKKKPASTAPRTAPAQSSNPAPQPPESHQI